MYAWERPPLLHEVIHHQPYWIEDMTLGEGHFQSNSMNKLLSYKKVGNDDTQEP